MTRILKLKTRMAILLMPIKKRLTYALYLLGKIGFELRVLSLEQLKTRNSKLRRQARQPPIVPSMPLVAK